MDTGLRLNIYVVDLGGGLRAHHGTQSVGVDDVPSFPLVSLLKGMRHPGVDWTHSPGVDLGGVFSIFAGCVGQNLGETRSPGAPNYAVISREYLNFSCRLGYHFATLDAYCGEVVNDNYITCSFKAGSAV